MGDFRAAAVLCQKRNIRSAPFQLPFHFPVDGSLPPIQFYAWNRTPTFFLFREEKHKFSYLHRIWNRKNKVLFAFGTFTNEQSFIQVGRCSMH